MFTLSLYCCRRPASDRCARCELSTSLRFNMTRFPLTRVCACLRSTWQEKIRTYFRNTWERKGGLEDKEILGSSSFHHALSTPCFLACFADSSGFRGAESLPENLAKDVTLVMNGAHRLPHPLFA